ncbi:EF0163 family protein [Enterococcus lactis]
MQKANIIFEVKFLEKREIMKRITCIILLLIGLLFVGVKYHELQEKYHDQEATITKLKKEKSEKSIVISEPQTDSNREKDGKTKEKEILESFVDAYVNFQSIDDRNQSMMDFVTEDCQKENALDIKVHADFDSKGTIESSYQSIADPDSFIVLGKEESRGASHAFLMNVHFTNDKIDSYTYKYMAQN